MNKEKLALKIKDICFDEIKESSKDGILLPDAISDVVGVLEVLKFTMLLAKLETQR